MDWYISIDNLSQSVFTFADPPLLKKLGLKGNDIKKFRKWCLSGLGGLSNIETDVAENTSIDNSKENIKRLIFTRMPSLTTLPIRLRFGNVVAFNRDKSVTFIDHNKHFLKTDGQKEEKQVLVEEIEAVVPTAGAGAGAGTETHTDPQLSSTYTMISFYNFFAVTDPVLTIATLRAIWKPFMVALFLSILFLIRIHKYTYTLVHTHILYIHIYI